MLVQIPDVLTPHQVAQYRKILDDAEWIDGRVTAGPQSGRVKDNMQLPEEHPAARQLGDLIVSALEKNQMFMAAALPMKVFPPLFNRYKAASLLAITWTMRSVRSTELRIVSEPISRLPFSCAAGRI